jgi:hypothetical protein
VCVLSTTYNAATRFHPDELKDGKGALRCLLFRLLYDLVFGGEDWMAAYDGSPLATAVDPVGEFKEMLGLLSHYHDAALLISIDEISKLLDCPECEWNSVREKKCDSAAVPKERKVFWSGLFDLTRASTNWVRIVMTGFTDSPNIAMSASDVACQAFELSMVRASDQQLLAAEIIWAYAADNTEPFPGFLFALVKSTPGLLGLWAQQIDLRLDGSGTRVTADIRLAMQSNTLATSVPWASKLQDEAQANWPKIFEFLVNEDRIVPEFPELLRAARNADLATKLGGKFVLSPFAVAATVCAVQKPVDDAQLAVWQLLRRAVGACSEHMAGCATNAGVRWQETVRRRLVKLRTKGILADSTLLTSDDRLSAGAPPLPTPATSSLGGAAHNAGRAFEDFLLYSVALRLECLRQSAHSRGQAEFPASAFLPEAVGMLSRAATTSRHPANAVTVALCTGDNAAFMARLCTQTAALLLPSSVGTNISGVRSEPLNTSYFDPAVPVLDLSQLMLTCAAPPEVDVSSADCPRSFPQLERDTTLSLEDNLRGQQRLVKELTANAKKKQQNASFNVDAYCRRFKANRTFVTNAASAVTKVAALARSSSDNSRAVVFKPTDKTNPLCDVVAIVPCRADPGRGVAFFLIEAKDRAKSNVSEKLAAVMGNELLLVPVAEHLRRFNITLVATVFVPVARAAFTLDGAGGGGGGRGGEL